MQSIAIKKEKAKIYNKKYKASHKEEIKARRKIWVKENPEKIAEQGRRRYKKHREEMILKQKERYQKNKEEIKKYQRRKREEEPEKKIYDHARRRAKKKGIVFTIKVEDISIPKKCPLLNIPLFIGFKVLGDNSPTLDRIKYDGGYVKDNIMVISYKANRMKSNSTFKEFDTMRNNWDKINRKED